MITFKDVRRTGENTFFIPEALKAEVLFYLQAADIPYQSINWKQMPESRKLKQQEAAKRFEEAGYAETFAIGAIVSDVDPEDMFQKVCQFFGDTIDPEYKEQRDGFNCLSHLEALAEIEALKKDYPNESWDYEYLPEDEIPDPRYVNSTFESEETYEQYAEAAISFMTEEIANWISSAKNGYVQEFFAMLPYDDYGVIGHGFAIEMDTNCIKRYETQRVCLILRRDDTMPLGFHLVTAYPDIHRYY